MNHTLTTTNERNLTARTWQQRVRNACTTLRCLPARALLRAHTLRFDDRGMGTIEVVLIIVVLVGLVLIFKREIGGLVQDVVNHIKSDAANIYN